MDHHIRNYDYKSIDRSLLAPYYKRICQNIINYIPLHTSPNIITLIGLIISMTSTLMVACYKNILDHSTLCYICFACLFIYQLIDILDGMQAGRVCMYYNPTTELFDHGCDSVTTVCVTYNILMLSGTYEREYILSMIFSLCILLNFYFSTWQHSNTKIMEFRAGLLNPTEMIFTIKCTFILLSIYPNIVIGYELYLVLFVIILTVVHFITAICETFSVSANSDIILMLSLFPAFLSVYQLYQFIKYGVSFNMINIMAPMVLGIVELLWLEISNEYVNEKTIYLCMYIFAINMLMPNTIFASLISIILLVNKFIIYINIMCSILGMKNFYDIRSRYSRE